MDCLPADVITKLCTETYLEEEVESAKRLLFDVCKPTERYKKRQGPNKSATNMADILRVLHSMDPSSVPTFVSATLHLPAVDFEHADITPQAGTKGVQRDFLRTSRRGSASRGPEETGSDGFRLVQKRKSRPRSVVGTARSSALSAVKVRPSEIFVTRLEPLTQPKDIEQYLNNTLSRKCVVSCVSLQTRYNSYSSFRVAVESDALPDVLAPSCWPNGVLVRRFHGTRPSGPP
ncbi:ATP-binding cassette sub- A member 5 [Branchiostoma belcheri]|nr:ATP-binding cassette sub- A member 5 [Branchiostoma belcheri]